MKPSMTTSFTMLKKRSPYHPNKRGKELERFGNPEFQAQATILLEILSQSYPVSVFRNDSLVVAIVRGAAMHQAANSETGEWMMSAEDWATWTGLKRHRLDVARKALVDAGELQVALRDFPPKSYYQLFHPQEERKVMTTFHYPCDLSHALGHDAAALFGWLLEVDKQSGAQGYYFHLKMADIQQSLGLSRFQVDQARKKLIEHDLMKERFWGIPAVREFRLRLDGLEQLVSEMKASE